MRKTSLVLLGAAAGAALTLLVSQPRVVFIGAAAKAAVADTYRQLNLFGDVFERVRSDYVEKPDDSKLVESAINGMLAGLDPHSSYMDSKSFRDMQVQTAARCGPSEPERGGPADAAGHKRPEPAILPRELAVEVEPLEVPLHPAIALCPQWFSGPNSAAISSSPRLKPAGVSGAALHQGLDVSTPRPGAPKIRSPRSS